jgi:hypothetical protein
LHGTLFKMVHNKQAFQAQAAGSAAIGARR